jgi:hypothetical protein
MASGSSLRCTSECLQFTSDTIGTDSKAVTRSASTSSCEERKL